MLQKYNKKGKKKKKLEKEICLKYNININYKLFFIKKKEPWEGRILIKKEKKQVKNYSGNKKIKNGNNLNSKK